MREIEAKYRVRDLGAVLAALREAGVTMGEPVHQDDLAYAPRAGIPARASAVSPSPDCAPRTGRTP